jgi:hypothetical protein
MWFMVICFLVGKSAAHAHLQVQRVHFANIATRAGMKKSIEELGLQSKPCALRISSLDLRVLPELPLQELVWLDASRNRLTGIRELKNHPELRVLFLAYNQISSLKGIEGLQKLHTLTLTGNAFPWWETLDFSGLESLESLSLEKTLLWQAPILPSSLKSLRISRPMHLDPSCLAGIPSVEFVS